MWLTTKLEAGRVIVNCDSVGSLKLNKNKSKIINIIPFLKTLIMWNPGINSLENSVDPDQVASEEAT